MTIPTPISPDARLRDDLTVAEIDGDLVVFDPVGMESHVLAGGAVVVWAELEQQTAGGVVERVARRTNRDINAISSEVDAVLAQFEELGLLTAAAPKERSGYD